MTTTLAGQAPQAIVASPEAPSKDQSSPSELLLGCAHCKRPPTILEKLAESIRNAEEMCVEDAASEECTVAWDKVEELSTAASHARDKLMADDPLKNDYKDSPEV
ncbi:hypothetical protein C4D60_Mb08t29940 [Musa balbisiana]|uniref:CP12 domain-containing protein n=1 Tax=Musa balbisiana TaxID=52838 RepID=A0A4S8K7K2_MUSBA|nr:hypothetical protein C4D60_Mb08t29940 [Musa balbisiana]